MLSSRIRQFIHEHDDIPAFHAGYLVMTVLAAAVFNLGFFLLLILIHVCFDAIKYRGHFGLSARETLLAVIAENFIDLMLFSIGLTFVIYFHHSFAIAAMSGLLRAEMTLLKGIGEVLPKFTILRHETATIGHPRMHLHAPIPHLRSKDFHGSIVIVGCIAMGLIVFSPLILGASFQHVAEIVVRELSIWSL